MLPFYHNSSALCRRYLGHVENGKPMSPRIVNCVCCPASGLGLITDAYRATVYKVAVPLVHTASGVDLAGVNGLIRSLPDFLIFIFILRFPAPRLIFTGQDEDQPQLWVIFPQAQNSLSRETVKSKGTPSAIVYDTTIIQLFNGLFQLFLHLLVKYEDVS